MAAMIELTGVAKQYGSVEVLSALSLGIAASSFTSLLGASGCGKTTILNMIAGLDQPSAGDIRIQDTLTFSSRRGIDVPAHRRNMGYVFQSYALWPHMRVIDNVAYPLRVRGVGVAERRRAAQTMLERLELDALPQRFPFELSGGQQQRVAIARALIHHPRVLLLDEPLSNLDVQLRERARAWIAKIHKEFNLTTVLVTHDHAEALSLSDRIVLLRGGRIEQEGAAQDIYMRPRTIYAADFVGGVNSFEAHVTEAATPLPDGTWQQVMALGDHARFVVPSETAWPNGAVLRIAVRPRHVRLSDTAPAAPGDHEAVLPFSVVSVLYRGEDWEVIGDTPLGEMRVVTEHVPAGQALFARIAAEDCRCLAD